MRPRCAVLILTKNEEKHIARALESIQPFADEVHIVDSYSTDGTLAIAEKMGARFYQNPWINYAAQFQWGLENCDIKADWIMRLDADEYIMPELAREINERLATLEPEITGVILKRRVHFMGKWMRHGGYYPIKLLRIWRAGRGRIEKKWMDEHIILDGGETIEFRHDLVDDNLNTLSWWTEKHNTYATREVIDLLNRKYHFFQEATISESVKQEQADRKRWLKDTMYGNVPLFFRAFLYFNFRYWLQLGFLDGRRGLIWHVLQGFWYRFLVDAKYYQIERRARETGTPVRQIIEEDFGFKIDF